MVGSVRLDLGECSGYFLVEQNLHQECVLAPLLFNLIFTAVIDVNLTRFKACKDVIDSLVSLRKKTGERGRGIAKTGDPS